MGKRFDVSKHILSIVSLLASLLVLDAELRRVEESNQKHFQLTAFIIVSPRSTSTLNDGFLSLHTHRRATRAKPEKLAAKSQIASKRHNTHAVFQSLSMFIINISFPFSIIRLITFFRSGIQNMFQQNIQ